MSAVASGDDWDAERSGEPKPLFEDLLRRRDLKAALQLMKYLEVAPSWPGDQLEGMAGEWRKDIRALARDWAELDRHERFAALQQVCIVLRTGLTNDVESRLR